MSPHSGSELLPESSSPTRRTHAVPMVPEEDVSVTESESEVEEDCDLWLDEAGRQWMRTAAFPGRWYLLGTGFDGSIWWDEPGLGSWRASWGSRWLSGFFCPSFVGVLTEPGPSSCVSLQWLLGEFPAFFAEFALCCMVPFFVVVSYLAVLFPVSGNCLWSTVLGFFGRCCFSLGRNAWLDSKYMFC